MSIELKKLGTDTRVPFDRLPISHMCKIEHNGQTSICIKTGQMEAVDLLRGTTIALPAANSRVHPLRGELTYRTDFLS